MGAVLLSGCGALPRDGLYTRARSPGDPFLFPLFLFFDVYPLHLQTCFEGHETYRSVDVLWTPGSTRAILTLLDGREIHLAGSDHVLEQIRSRESPSKTIKEEVLFEPSTEGGDRAYTAFFSGIHGEPFQVLTVPHGPSAQGLLDPKSRGEGAYLPILFRTKSWLGSKDSFVKIDGIAQKIPSVIDTFFFTGIEAFFTENLKVGLIFSNDRTYCLRTGPRVLRPGVSWTFQDDAGAALELKILKAHEGELTIGSKGIVARTRLSGTHLEVEGLKAIAPSGAMEIEFAPPLPDLFLFEASRVVEGVFEISIDNDAHLVEGLYRVHRAQTGIELLLLPKEPTWARQRCVTTLIEREGAEVRVRSAVGVESF